MKPALAIKHVLGRKYRINDPSSRYDGRVGTLESVQNGEAWLLVHGRLARVPADRVTDRNVVQIDLAPLRVRNDAPLVWGDEEVFA